MDIVLPGFFLFQCPGGQRRCTTCGPTGMWVVATLPTQITPDSKARPVGRRRYVRMVARGSDQFRSSKCQQALREL